MTFQNSPEVQQREALQLHRDSRGVVTMTLDSGKINIVNTKVVEEIVEAVQTLSKDTSVRCLILRGNDRAFIGGADINEMVGLNPDSARTFISGLYRMCAAVRVAPFPVIAGLHGWCFGIGPELAAACDIRIGSTGSWYAMPEVKIGIPSVVQASLLPALIGAGRARWWVLTGRRIDAKTALEWGYLSEVVEENALDAAIESVVADICECPPNAIRIQKQLCNDWEADFPDNSARASIDVFGQTYETDEPSTAMNHFLQSRKKK
jgi:enoyl-CoA hydratase/carnithine racemase